MQHDVVFWLGDFNYRIDLPGDQVKQCVYNGDLVTLKSADQLGKAKADGQTFVGFQEGDIHFAPTYKYDTFSDDYDTSEKCRSPAWTDRILWRVRHPVDDALVNEQPERVCEQLLYDRAELKTSDHRPVGALFAVNLRRVAADRREEIYRGVVQAMGPPDATVIVTVDDNDGGEFPVELVTGIRKKIADLDLVVCIEKFVNDEMWLIFADGRSAEAALMGNGLRVEGRGIRMKLRTEEWRSILEGELADERLRRGRDVVDEDYSNIAKLQIQDDFDDGESLRLNCID